ncbi:MAG: hypothetical protein K6A67_11350 [Bacteroidales bacterium]|nr:hypothetical protein [Bacteroidales bacterium]
MDIKKIINSHIEQQQKAAHAAQQAYVALCKSTKRRAEHIATELQPLTDYGYTFHVYQHYKNAYIITVSLNGRTYCTIYPIVQGGEQLNLYNRFDVNRHEVAVMRSDRLSCMSLEQLACSMVASIPYCSLADRQAA